MPQAAAWSSLTFLMVANELPEYRLLHWRGNIFVKLPACDLRRVRCCQASGSSEQVRSFTSQHSACTPCAHARTCDLTRLPVIDGRNGGQPIRHPQLAPQRTSDYPTLLPRLQDRYYFFERSSKAYRLANRYTRTQEVCSCTSSESYSSRTCPSPCPNRAASNPRCGHHEYR